MPTLGAKHTTVLDPNGTERTVEIDALVVGTRLVMQPGTKTAPMGWPSRGQAVDASLLIGERVPVDVRVRRQMRTTGDGAVRRNLSLRRNVVV